MYRGTEVGQVLRVVSHEVEEGRTRVPPHLSFPFVPLKSIYVWLGVISLVGGVLHVVYEVRDAPVEGVER